MKIPSASLAAKFSRMELFSTVPAPILGLLAEQSSISTFPAGGMVFHKDEPGRSLYLILSGAVKVHDEDYTVAQLQKGSCFGELALLDEGPRSMSVTATEPTALAVIERDVFFEVFGNEPDVMRKIVGTLTQRLRRQTDKLVEQLRRREEELTRLVEERTAELNRQKEKAEAEKQEAEYQRQRAEQSEQFEQQFLANMSHEIRTPMNAVTGMTNILLQKNPRADQMRYLESIRDASGALLVILNDILDISKIQAGRMELEDADFSLTQILAQVKATLQFRADEKGILLKTECDTAVPPVLVGDPVRLQQILLNLAGNAVKFTEKGSARLFVRLLEKGRNTCRLHFEVRDTGIGMTAEQSAVVFESFRQAAGDTTRRYGGTGLGLSISKQLVELFGGALEVQSPAPGGSKGSIFHFAISLKISKKKALPKEETVLPKQATALKGLRILVAEDNEYNRIVAVETLELMLPDVKIDTAENGKEAVEKVKTGAYDLVLMDVNMPEMDGLEATRLIRALPAPKNALPVIAFTASVVQSEIQKCEAAGMNAVVPKPFKESELMGAIHAVVTQNSSDDFESSDEYTAPSQPSDDLEPSDGAGLEFLEQLTGGNRARVRKYLGLYLESAQTSLPKIEAALAANDREGLRRAVHTLKPQFKMVGLAAAAELTEKIENRLLNGIEPNGVLEETDRLLSEIRQSVGIFEQHLRQ